MQLFVFSNSNEDIAHRLQSELLPFSNLIEVRYFSSFQIFTSALRKSLLTETLIIYCVDDQKCLHHAHSIKKLLIKAKLLIIFKDSDTGLVSKMNDLHPRYYTFASGDLKDVKAVLARMIHSFQQSSLDGYSSRLQHQVSSDDKLNTFHSSADQPDQ